MHAINIRQREHCAYLTSAVNIEVVREEIVASVLKHYRKDPELQHKQLNVTFKGEVGLDLDGLTREMFNLFFSTLFGGDTFAGNLQKIPRMDHR